MLYDEMSWSTRSSSRFPSPESATLAPETADPCDIRISLLRASSALYFVCMPRYSCLTWNKRSFLIKLSIKTVLSVILTFFARKSEPELDILLVDALNLIPFERFLLSADESRFQLLSTLP